MCAQSNRIVQYFADSTNCGLLAATCLGGFLKATPRNVSCLSIFAPLRDATLLLTYSGRVSIGQLHIKQSHRCSQSRDGEGLSRNDELRTSRHKAGGRIEPGAVRT